MTLNSTVAKATLLQPRRLMHASAPGAVRHDSQRPTSVDARRLFELQRLAGNQAVADLLLGNGVPPAAHLLGFPMPWSRKAVQREVGGWDKADKRGKGWNVHSQVVEGTKINRIPVDGIKLGNQEAFYGGDKDKTTESAAGRAVVLLPEALNPGMTIDVMLHLHGYEFREGDPYAGWRQRSSDQTVRDVALDRIEQQMQAAGTTQVIAVLAQGIGESRFGPGKKKYNLPYNEYVEEVLGLVANMGLPQLPKVPKDWKLVLSAHSGGGITIAGGDKVREPANLAEIVLFDAINRKEAAKNVGDWVEEHMKLVREAPVDQRAKALKDCPRLRAYYSDTPTYVTTYGLLETRMKKLYEDNPDDLKAALQARFPLPVHIQGAAHETVVRGLGDDPKAGPLADALIAIDNPEAKSNLLHDRPAKPKPGAKGRAAKPALRPAAATPAAPRTVIKPADEKAGAAKGGTAPKSKARRKSVSRPIPTGAITSERLGALDTPADTKFRKDVYDEQMRRSLADPKKEFVLGLPDKEIGSVDGYPIRKDVAPDAQAMINAIRAALKAAKAQDKNDKSDPLARGCSRVGISNAYRSLEGDFDAWQNAYSSALDRNDKARQRLKTGAYGKDAVGIMVDDLYGTKAMPGFSNHTRGLAIDFTTTQDGAKLGPKKKQKEAWRQTWLHHWLAGDKSTPGHAQDFKFGPLATEEWHWDHANGVAGAASGDEAAEAKLEGGSGGGGGGRGGPGHAAKPQQPAAPKKPAVPMKPKPVGALADAKSADQVQITFGSKARADVVAASSLEILRDVLHAAGLTHATITSTARTAEDQARAMYQNLVGTGKGQGEKAQRRLYRGRPGTKVIDTFVELSKKGLGGDEIQKGMRDKIVEIGPAKVSRHCADPSKLNVIDVGPNSLGGEDEQKALVAAGKAEEGKRVSKFIPYPKDPGDHFEIPPK